ncbi:formate hydrogenlyase transcriptional activator [Flavobacterium sp. 7E]|uniref:sigma-54 interaction domain-containing protein n=1 Tax=Flavobacterium sp. 7E TaxID=2735898 RepID=UPI00156D63B3|nr:sigma-54 dependent transcriptional regulator [Flavobacterium sp. 7E]NRS87815.1 formate hydrogenlyase transcriptional activator [Flavobacterium sp. 7E]
METSKDKYEALLGILKNRELEQSLYLDVCNHLIPCKSANDLQQVFISKLKTYLDYDYFCIAQSDVSQLHYRILCNDQTVGSKTFFDASDCVFAQAQNIPDKTEYELRQLLSDTKNIPPFLSDYYKNGIRKVIAFPLPYHNKQTSILYLFLKKGELSREAYRLIRQIAPQLSITVANITAIEKLGNLDSHLEKKNSQTTEHSTAFETNQKTKFPTLIGNSIALQKIAERIERVAASDATVLIYGESGTGKELVAQAIFSLSNQKKKKLITVNCASIPESLIISELFGHEKGSFTGATEKKIGKFELAHNGTLFLDEIGELSLEHQSKLLRVLQEQEIERIGGNKTISIKVRIIAATNRNLEVEVQKGNFRADLLYRLHVFPIHLPALRERKEDIMALSMHFLQVYTSKNDKKITGFTSKAKQTLQHYSWPGNIRELQHTIERTVLLTTTATIATIDLPKIEVDLKTDSFEIKTLDEMQKQYILQVLKKCNGRISGPFGAALKLQLPPTTLISKMQKLGIKKEHFVL